MTTGPYGAAALTYWQAGWRGILPLPPKKKKNPPSGYTGESGTDPSYPDVHAWTEDRADGNICLRLPRDIIGLDVDNYGAKQGALAIDAAEAQWGELPPTWRSTSRDDGVSGIRLYRVPEGLSWPGELGHDTEIIQHKHRYMLVCPSVHPDTGSTYRWINPAGITSTTIPDRDELPTLPDTWVEGITRGQLAVDTARGTFTANESASWLVTLPGATAPLCTRMTKAVEQTGAALRGSAHSAARDGALRAIRLAQEQHAGLVTALGQMQKLFLDDATSPDRALLGKTRRTETEARKEWQDIVTSAANLVQANPSDGPTCDCYGQITGLLVTTPTPPTATAGSSALAPALSAPLPGVPPLPAPAPSEQERSPVEADKRLKDGASFILDAPTEVPTIWGDGDEAFWTVGEALMLCGPPGVGKTTLCGQILRARLGLASSVLGLTVTTTESKVLYLAMDRPAQIARALRRVFTEDDRDTLSDKLMVWQGPPPGDVAKNTGVLLAMAQMAGADTLIIDSLKDAAIGLTEDEIGAGYNRARQTALAGGVQVLELHHMTKRGGGGQGAKPDTLADVYGSAWLTAGAGSVVLLWGAAGDLVVEMKHLKQPAAEVGPYKIVHDHAAGRSEVYHQTDLLEMVASQMGHGLTAKAAAVALFEKDSPNRNEVEKARRRLDALVTQGHLRVQEGTRGGGEDRSPATWHVLGGGNHGAGEQSRTNHATPGDHGASGPITGNHGNGKRAGQAITDPITGNHADQRATTNHGTTTPIRGGSGVGSNSDQDLDVWPTVPKPSAEGDAWHGCRTCGQSGTTLNIVGECGECAR